MSDRKMSDIRVFLTDDMDFNSGPEMPLDEGEKPPIEPVGDHVEGYGDKGIDAVSFDFCGGQMLS